jgi:phosphoglycerate dehydrogenase-like enzyme
LLAFARDLDAVLVAQGSPKVTEEVFAGCPKLKFVGELEGDRFGYRIDLEAAWARGIKTVDTTHGSSFPVPEWALALALIGLRNAGAHFRRMIQPEAYGLTVHERPSDPGYIHGELTGKTVGLIGLGHIGRRLLELLRPFEVTPLGYDPFVPKVVPDIYDVEMTSLETLMSSSQVVFVLAPLTPSTRGLIGRDLLALMKDGSVLVNVSRGAVIRSSDLIERLRKGDIIACLDVFDPEPIPADCPLKPMPNVFLSPHIAGVSLANYPRFLSLMIDELERFFSGRETRHDLTPDIITHRRRGT